MRPVWVTASLMTAVKCSTLASGTWFVSYEERSQLKQQHGTNKRKQACHRRQQLRPGAANWRTRRNVTSSLILAHWLHYVKS